jgi:hypothetical protein
VYLNYVLMHAVLSVVLVMPVVLMLTMVHIVAKYQKRTTLDDASGNLVINVSDDSLQLVVYYPACTHAQQG